MPGAPVTVRDERTPGHRCAYSTVYDDAVVSEREALMMCSAAENAALEIDGPSSTTGKKTTGPG